MSGEPRRRCGDLSAQVWGTGVLVSGGLLPRGAGVRTYRRRCGKWGMTCATVAPRNHFCGAGPNPKTSPAPETATTCAKVAYHLHYRTYRPIPQTPSALATYAVSPSTCATHPPIDPPAPENYSSVFSAKGRGFPTILATDSCSSPKQRASCAMEVLNER